MLGRGDWQKIETQVNAALEAVMGHVRALEARVEALEGQIGASAKEEPQASAKRGPKSSQKAA